MSLTPLPSRFARLVITGEARAEPLREVVEEKMPLLFNLVAPQQMRLAMLATLAERDRD